MKKPGKMISEVLSHVAKKPATDAYPFGEPYVPKGLRGAIKFFADKCVGCKLCMKDCPAEAITINKVGDKQFEATFALDRCLYCAQCVYSCNKGALASSSEFELAALDRADLKVTFRIEPKKEDEPGAPKTPAPKTSNS